MDRGMSLRKPSSVSEINWGKTVETGAAEVPFPSYTLTGKQLGTALALRSRDRGHTVERGA
jgi:hypothetical protein